MNRICAKMTLCVSALMMLLSPAAFADDQTPTPQEIKAELEKLKEKGGKAAEVANDFLNSDCANQLATAPRRAYHSTRHEINTLPSN